VSASTLTRKDYLKGNARILCRVLFYGKSVAGAAQTYVWSGHVVPDLSLPAEARVIAFGFTERPLSGYDGSLRAGTCSVQLADIDYTLRGFLDSITQYGLLNAVAHIQWIREADWRVNQVDIAASNPPTYDWNNYFRGEVARYKPESGYVFSLELNALGTRKMSKAFPLPLLLNDFGGQLPPEARSLYAPFLIGEKNGEGSDTPAPTLAAETASGMYFNGDEYDIGYGNKAGTTPTNPAAVASGSGGSITPGTYYVRVTFTPTGSAESEQAPFFDDDLPVVIAAGEKIAASCDNMGTGTYKFYFSDGNPTNKAHRSQYVMSSSTPSVLFDGTNGSVPTSSWIKNYHVFANMPDGRTVLSGTVASVGQGPLRRVRLTAVPVVGADSWGVAVREGALGVGPIINPLGFVRLWDGLDVTQLNGDGNWWFEDPQDGSTGEALENGLQLSRGMLPALYIGDVVADVDGGTWKTFLVSYGVCKEITSIYQLNSTTDQVERIPDADYSTTIACPGKGAFSAHFTNDYVTKNDRRYSVFYAIGPQADDAATGDRPFYVNAIGMEVVGDGSGAAITDGYDQLAFILDNFILADVPHPVNGGDWATAIPAWSDATPKRNASSWTSAKSDAAQVISSALRSHFIAAAEERVTNADLIATLLIGLDVGMGADANGAAMIVLHPPAPPTITLDPTITHVEDILDGGFDIDDDPSGHFTKLEYDYGYDDVAADFVGGDQLEDDAATTAYDNEDDPAIATLELPTVIGAGVAVDIAARAIARLSRPDRTVIIPRAFHGAHVELGSRFPATHPEGAATGGFQARRMQVRRIIGDIDGHMVQLACHDLDWVLPLTQVDVTDEVLEASSLDQVVNLDALVTVMGTSALVSGGTVRFSVYMPDGTLLGTAVVSGTVASGLADADFTVPGGTGA
jgi:hypothetical protein